MLTSASSNVHLDQTARIDDFIKEVSSENIPLYSGSAIMTDLSFLQKIPLHILYLHPLILLGLKP